MNNPTLGEFCFTMKRASYPCGNFSDTFSCFKKFLLTQKRASYRARKSMYDVHQTCVRGSSNLCTWLHLCYNKKAAAKNFTPSAWNFFSSWVFANWFALCTERPAPLNSSSLSFCYYSLLLPTQDHLKVLVFFRKFFQVRFEPQQRRALWKNKNWEITQQE